MSKIVELDDVIELIENYKGHEWPEDLACQLQKTLRDNIKTADAIPVEWLQYMQQECLSENDRTMVGAIEEIFIEWHIYVNRLREMNRQKEQEAR